MSVTPNVYSGVKVAAKKRKKGDWEAIAKSRALIPRILAPCRGVSNVPPVNETGSAAYRRLQAKKDGRK